MTQVSDQTRIRETVVTGIEGDDFSACDGEFYVRGYIRSIAGAVGADPEPLIREYEAAQLGPQAGPDDADQRAALIRMHERRLPGWTALLGVTLALGLCFAAVHFLTGWPLATGAASSARAHSLTDHFGHGKQATPAPDTTTRVAVTVRTLTPASAAAFGASGAGQGDNGDQARLAIDANPATAWHTDWYTSAHFGNLYPGTGLLVDMGRPVTITAARITLGNGHGAGLELRVGAAPALADLPAAAHVANAGSVIRVRLPTPAHGRYVLIWFTSLPPDSAGTFQARVYDLQLEGRA